MKRKYKKKKWWKARGKVYFVIKVMFIEYEMQIQNQNMIQKIRVSYRYRFIYYIILYYIIFRLSLDAQCKIWILKQRLMADWCQYSWMTFDKDTSQWITELWWQLRLLSLSLFVSVFYCVLTRNFKQFSCCWGTFQCLMLLPHSVSLLPSPPWGQQQFYCHPVNTAAPPPSSYAPFQHTSSGGRSP